MIDAVIELAYRYGAGGLVAQDPHAWRKIELQLVHPQHLFGRLRDEHVAMLERTDHLKALDKEVARSGQHPGPAWRVQFAHATTSTCLMRVPGRLPSIIASAAC